MIDIKAKLIGFFENGVPEFGLGKIGIRVIPADPAHVGDIDCVAINRTADSEDKAGVGNFIGESEVEYLDDDDEDKIDSPGTVGGFEEKIGSDYNESYEIRIWAKSMIKRDELYQKVKERLHAIGNVLTKMDDEYGDVISFQLVSGADEMDAIIFPGLTVYMGVFQWSVKNRMTLRVHRGKLTSINIREKRIEV